MRLLLGRVHHEVLDAQRSGAHVYLLRRRRLIHLSHAFAGRPVLGEGTIEIGSPAAIRRSAMIATVLNVKGALGSRQDAGDAQAVVRSDRP
jgi:hypothetical protein